MVAKKETKTVGAKQVFAWIFSILFIVAGIGLLTDSFIAGIFMFLAGVIILPPFDKMLEDKANLKFTTWLKVIIVLALLVFSGMAIPDTSLDDSNQENLALSGNSNNQNTETMTETIYVCSDGSSVYDSSECDSEDYSNDSPEKDDEVIPEEDSKTESNKATIGERNALKSAKSYFSFTSFSYEGLIKQLKYEGYSYDEAEYAVDNCGADWNEQAMLKAQEYLDVSSFSKKGLITQLEYEKFTHEQAVYGVNSLTVDWNEQAALKAQEYLDIMPFSRESLITQLEYEGFTSSQAEYGVDAVGY